jgi:hypothetical protein
MSTRPSLTPLADLGRSARQAPLHRLHAARIRARGDDAEIGASLVQRCGINVRFGSRLFHVRHALGALSEHVPKKPLRALAAGFGVSRAALRADLRAALRASAASSRAALAAVLRLTLATLAISVSVAPGLTLRAASARSRASVGA